MRKKDKKIRDRMRSVAGIICLLAVSFLFSWMNYETRSCARNEKIRVGYIDYGGFIENINGNYIGYGVEYLEKIAEYTGYQYEYVYDTWENCLKRLEQGDIDLVCTAQYTKERAERFSYSQMPLGYESTVLYVQSEKDIFYEDWGAMDGCRVGLLQGSFQTEEFFVFAEENDLAFEPYYFETEQQIMDALENDAVDMAAVGSLACHADVKAVGRYGAEAFYCMTGKGNEALTEEIDEALKQIRIEVPGLETELTQKYYGLDRISSSPLFSREEHEYIQHAKPIKICLLSNMEPLCYEKNGKLGGIFTEYLNLISQKSGLQFDIELVPTSAVMEQRLSVINASDYLVLYTKKGIEYKGLNNRILASNAMLDLEMTYVKRQNEEYDGRDGKYVFAITQDMRYLQIMLLQDNIGHTIKYYNTPEECMEAVIVGEADLAIQDSYVVTGLLQKPRYADELMEYPGEDLENGICIVATDEYEMLIGILNKTINYISEEEKSEIVTAELLMNSYNRTLLDTIYEYRYLFIGAGISLILAAAIYAVLVQRMTRLKVEKKQYEKLQKQVQQDELTGVYNRKSFFEKAKEMIDTSATDMCIVIMDISNFKVVNDLYGMEVGDRLLCQMANELLKLGYMRRFIVGRFTGDHFYMCMSLQDFQEIHFPRRYKTFLEEMDITVAYGVFVVEGKRDIPVNIMCDRASLAVHNKERQRMEYIRYYSEEERKRIIQEQEIENDMEKALEMRQFCSYIQPKYDIYEEKIVGGEALVRWIHPQKGLIPPGAFISLFEKNGFIVRLDYYIWEEACRLQQKLKRQGICGCPISINVSRAHFYGKELRDKLEELIAKYQLLPEDLELEITETICAEDPDVIYKRIRELQEVGFKIAMDDFGSGYSSLNMLKEMPLDILKMDLKFLDGGDDPEKSHNILKTLITLALSLNLVVVVEGVETKEQVDFLRVIGNQYVQGYYFSKPVDCETYEEMLKQNRE